jgi:hypothetical protein
MRKMVLCLGSGGSSQAPDGSFRPGMANWMNEAAIDGRISIEPNQRSVLHDREIDTPTLSPECSQPSPQSVKNPPTHRHRP